MIYGMQTLFFERAVRRRPQHDMSPRASDHLGGLGAVKSIACPSFDETNAIQHKRREDGFRKRDFPQTVAAHMKSSLFRR